MEFISCTEHCRQQILNWFTTLIKKPPKTVLCTVQRIIINLLTTCGKNKKKEKKAYVTSSSSRNVAVAAAAAATLSVPPSFNYLLTCFSVDVFGTFVVSFEPFHMYCHCRHHHKAMGY